MGPTSEESDTQLSPPSELLNRPPEELSTVAYNVFGFCWSMLNKPIGTRPAGEPNPIQHIETHGIHCRNFHIDPSGRLLVASHIMGLPVRDGTATRFVPACLSVFRIGEDGRLDFVRKYDVETDNRQMFWMGMVAL